MQRKVARAPPRCHRLAVRRTGEAIYKPFKAREKRRLEPLKEDLFTDAACEPGLYRGQRRPFCLYEHRA